MTLKPAPTPVTAITGNMIASRSHCERCFWHKLRPNSAAVAVAGVTLPIFPQKHFRQATQDNGTNQDCQSDQVPTSPDLRHDAETVQQSDECHHQEEGTGDVTV
jgi:hypothetical protein